MATRTTEDEKEFDLIRDLKEAIRGSGVSIAKLSRQCDMNTAQLYRFMDGTRGLNIQAIDKICRTLRLRLRTDEPKKVKGK